jgi:hypothetical protein
MPTAFTITAANNALNLDAQGRGETAFTVSNSAKRPLRGRARIIPLGAAKADWFSLDGEAEREFPADGTQQFTVRVAPPADAPPGKQSFRLDAAAVDNPDEWFAEGPTVGFEIKPPPPAPVKKPFPWSIVAVVAAVCLIGGLAAWFFLRPSSGEAAPMPKLKDRTVEEVPAILQASHLANSFKTEIKDEDLREGPSQVIQSFPDEGKPIKPGDIIVLIVSKPGAKVPTMRYRGRFHIRRNLFLKEALEALRKAGLEFGDLLVDPTQANKPVVSTVPPEGTLLPLGSKVSIQMPGPSNVLTPNIRVETLLRASQQIIRDEE